MIRETLKRCKRCGRPMGRPIYSTHYYAGRPCLIWECPRTVECEYVEVLPIYRDPAVEIQELRVALRKAEIELKELKDAHARQAESV